MHRGIFSLSLIGLVVTGLPAFAAEKPVEARLTIQNTTIAQNAQVTSLVQAVNRSAGSTAAMNAVVVKNGDFRNVTFAQSARATSVVQGADRSPDSVLAMNAIRIANGTLRDSTATQEARASSVVHVLNRSPGAVVTMNYFGG